MKVCFISYKSYFLFNEKYTGTFGGAEIQLYFLSTELAKDPSFSVSMVVGDYGQPSFQTIENVKLIKYIENKTFLERIKFIRFFAKSLRFYFFLRRINAHIYIQRCKNDLTAFTAFFCNFAKKKFIFMAASDPDVLRKSPEVATFYANYLHNYGIKNSDLIIVQNRKQKELLKINFRKDSLIQKNAFPIIIPEGNKRNGILWVGRCVKLKQPEKVFEIAKRNPDKEFTMICKSVSYKLDYYNDIKCQSGEISNVTFIEYVPFKEIGTYFKKAKIFINTSIYEGFPNTFLQAWRCGTPVISLHVNPDNIIDLFGLGFHSKTLLQMQTDLNVLYSDTKRYKKMSDAACKYVKQNHDIEKIIREFKRHLHSQFHNGI